MKKLLILTAALLLLLTAAACAKEEPVPTEIPTEAPTDAPYIDTQLDEPEWTLAEGELQLQDDSAVYAENADILYFAIVTNPDGSQELRFRLSDEKAAQLAAQRPADGSYITLNGEKIGAATLSDDGKVATITAADAEGEITALATKIRGVLE